MSRHLAPSALLATGWADRVLFEVDDSSGTIIGITPNASADAGETLAGPVVPGMPCLHSIAFQRGMAGLTEKGGPQGDSFWSWRKLMYRFLENLRPDDVEAIATQVYIEMLRAGYTSVAEFHYLHHDAGGAPYANPAEVGERLQGAASATGIAQTLLPVLYAHDNFGGMPPTIGQRRFITDIPAYTRIVESLMKSASASRAQRIGIAPHSLRAVTPAQLSTAVTLADALAPGLPIHLNLAAQLKEVNDCLAWSGQRPVSWLLDHLPVDGRWCLIHATHTEIGEAERMARSGAVAGLCPTTEGDLGDGFFNAVPYLRAGGRIGIGADSCVGIDPFLELRLFEYGQRLRFERRNVLAKGIGDSLGGHLYRSAAAGGAQALAQPVGSLAIGLRADWLVLNDDDPALAEQRRDGLLDAAIFGPARRPVRDVMVAGHWVIRDGEHAAGVASLARYRAVMKRLLG
jgi:formimidoylglutamate deiminase